AGRHADARGLARHPAGLCRPRGGALRVCEGGHVSERMRRFLPRPPDIVGLLTRQAAVTADGLAALARWSETGADADSQAVRDAEHEADDLRQELLQTLTTALSTPIDQEDAYALSERIDEVIDSAKDVVRLAGALEWKPDVHGARMAARAA